MFGEVSSALVLRDCKVVTKDNNDNNDNSFSPNPTTSTPQPITGSHDQNDNSVSPDNDPKPNPGKDNQSENKENDIEKNPTNPVSENSSNQNDNKTLVINFKNIKKITLTSEGNLVIEFNKESNLHSTSQTITPEQINLSQELQKVNDYLKKNNQTSLSSQELDKLFSKNHNNSKSTKEPPQNNNNKVLISCVLGITLISGIVIGLCLRKKKFREN